MLSKILALSAAALALVSRSASEHDENALRVPSESVLTLTRASDGVEIKGVNREAALSALFGEEANIAERPTEPGFLASDFTQRPDAAVKARALQYELETGLPTSWSNNTCVEVSIDDGGEVALMSLSERDAALGATGKGAPLGSSDEDDAEDRDGDLSNAPFFVHLHDDLHTFCVCKELVCGRVEATSRADIDSTLAIFEN